MSVNWEDSTSKARVYALASANRTGEFNSSDPTWGIYCDLRNALIWALLVTGFPPRSDWAITEKNWQEVYCRLAILERVNNCQRTYNNGNRPSRKVYFTPEEIHSMIGLSVNAGNKSDAEFRKHMFKMLEDAVKYKLDGFINPTPRDIEDPYWWERTQAPLAEEESK